MRVRVGALGIAPLDTAVGALSAGQGLLVTNDPGVPVEPILYQAAFYHLNHGRPVVYVVYNRTPSSVRSAMKQQGHRPDGFGNRLIFVDAYSSMIGVTDEADYRLRDPYSFRELQEILLRIAQERPGAVLILDPLSQLVDYLTVQHYARIVPGIRKVMGQYRLTIGLFTAWPYPEDTRAVVDSFDAVISCKAAEDRILFGQYFQIDRTPRANARPRPPYPYRVEQPGGVLVYVPKIVITGPTDAGKTTFVHAVSEWARSSEFEKSTVALDFGHVNVDGMATDLFGTPGQNQFDPIVERIADQAYGVILVVDSTRPETFARARDMLLKAGRTGIPVVIAANKQDLPNAIPPDSVAVYVRNPFNAPVVGCVANDKASAQQVLHALLQRIFRGVVKA